MRVLLDTHTLIWAQDEPARLGASAVLTLQDPANELVMSAVTVWEIGIKIAIGKLKLALPFRSWVAKAILDLNLVESPIRIEYVDLQIGLPFHHRDPFDRLLASQSLVDGVSLVSGDPVFDTYGVPRIWN
jgi:PIN domain nuclease of toxin-antitoxin system